MGSMRLHLPRPLALALVLAAFLLGGCSDSTAQDDAIPGAAVAVDDPFSGGYPTYDDEATGLRIVLGTPDVAVGRSRVSFALFDLDGLVSVPSLDVMAEHYPEGSDGEAEPQASQEFTFRPFPDGGRGIYTSTVDFTAPGLWALRVALPASAAPGTGVDATEVVFPIEVGEDTIAPDTGDPAPASVNRTVEDEPNFAELTTASEPDPRLYDATIAGTLDAGQPFVVTFASPAFCTNALCGPQVEVLSELADDHGEQAAFIHVDLYENPTEIRGDLSVARRTPVLEEWGVHTDEWTFVVDGDGVVRARFEGFAPREEVEEALLAVLTAPGA